MRKKEYMKKKYIAAFGCFVGLLSCEKGNIKPIDPTVVSYHKDIEPIIEAHCIQCHSMGSKSIELYDYEHIAEIVETGQLEGCLFGDTNFAQMPMDHVLDDSTKNVVYMWIDQGFLDN